MKISLRISTYLWMDATRRQELLDMLANYRDTIDEVAFFTGFTHPPLPLAAIQERASLLGEIIPQFKALGLSTGINHLATLGHLDENLENSLNESWQHMVDITGAVSKSCYCAADPQMQAYIRQVYTFLAAARPDFIWIDDDVRMESHQPSITMGCFCELCLADFYRQTGSGWTRPDLEAALNQAEGAGKLALRHPEVSEPCRGSDEGLALRRKWLEHNRKYIGKVLGLARSAVDQVNPGLPLGLMTGETVYSGLGNNEWAKVMAGANAIEVKWRPGGGFYTDTTPRDGLVKAHSIGRQTALLPADLVDVQYEHENFPYQVLKKSKTMFLAESCAAIAAGCTGVALNTMGISSDPFGEYLPYFDAVRSCRTFFSKAVETFDRQPALGIWPAVTIDHAAVLNLAGEWVKASLWGTDFARFTELSEIGLPTAYSPQGACCILLTGESAAELSQDALLNVLAGGVLIDGPALAVLEQRGLGAYTGFSISGSKDRDTLERFTADPLNGRFAGWSRDCRPSFWPENSYLLKPLPGARPLAELYDFTPTCHGICAGVFENQLGGRTAVMGYYPWASIQSLAKTSQLKTLLRWLSRDTLSAYVESYHKAAVWCRPDASRSASHPAEGKTALMLINCSLDAVDGLSLMIKAAPTAARLVRMDGSQENLASTGRDGVYARFTLNHLQPWDAVLITQE